MGDRKTRNSSNSIPTNEMNDAYVISTPSRPQAEGEADGERDEEGEGEGERGDSSFSPFFNQFINTNSSPIHQSNQIHDQHNSNTPTREGAVTRRGSVMVPQRAMAVSNRTPQPSLLKQSTSTLSSTYSRLDSTSSSGGSSHSHSSSSSSFTLPPTSSSPSSTLPFFPTPKSFFKSSNSQFSNPTIDLINLAKLHTSQSEVKEELEPEPDQAIPSSTSSSAGESEVETRKIRRGTRNRAVAEPRALTVSKEGGKKRRTTNKEEQQRLSEEFDRNSYPDAETKAHLSLELNMTAQAVSIWFANRRMNKRNMGSRFPDNRERSNSPLPLPPSTTASASVRKITIKSFSRFASPPEASTSRSESPDLNHPTFDEELNSKDNHSRSLSTPPILSFRQSSIGRSKRSRSSSSSYLLGSRGIREKKQKKRPTLEEVANKFALLSEEDSDEDPKGKGDGNPPETVKDTQLTIKRTTNLPLISTEEEDDFSFVSQASRSSPSMSSLPTFSITSDYESTPDSSFSSSTSLSAPSASTSSKEQSMLKETSNLHFKKESTKPSAGLGLFLNTDEKGRASLGSTQVKKESLENQSFGSVSSGSALHRLLLKRSGQ